MGIPVIISHGNATYEIKARIHKFKKKEYAEDESPAGVIVPYLKAYIKLTDLQGERPEPGSLWILRFEEKNYEFTEVIDHDLTNMLICQLKPVSENNNELMEHFNFGTF